jgi:hypothetical protein
MTTITQFPDPPSTADPANFSAEADAFIAAFPTFVDEINEFGAALNSLSTTSTSVSSVLIGTGTKNFTVETGKSYFVGMSLKLAFDATNWMVGEVISYNSDTGALSVNVVKVTGSGTRAVWVITLGFNGIVDFAQTSGVASSGANSNITSLSGVTAINTPGGIDIKGTNTNDSAAAGDVGEYIESSVLVGSAVNLTSDVAANVTSISLTAGDWDVSAIGRIHANNASTSFTQGLASISATSATLDAVNQVNTFSAAAVPGNGVNYAALGVPSTRISLAATTTIYLVCRAKFTVSTAQAYGVISARRVR